VLLLLLLIWHTVQRCCCCCWQWQWGHGQWQQRHYTPVHRLPGVYLLPVFNMHTRTLSLLLLLLLLRFELLLILLQLLQELI
jgi:hypothetical protein